MIRILLALALSLGSLGAAYAQQPVTLRPDATQAGLTTVKVIAAATTNATLVKASPGRVYGWSCYNAAAAARYLHLYNLAVAPTVGTSVPTVTIGVAPSGSFEHSGNVGVNYSAGIALSMTTGMADTDATATVANDIVCNIRFN